MRLDTPVRFQTSVVVVLVAVLVALTIGFLVGRASLAPPPELATAMETADSLRKTNRAHEDTLAQVRQVVAGLQVEADSAGARKRREVAQAVAAERERITTVGATDATIAALAMSQGARDSLQAALAAERAATERGLAGWRSAMAEAEQENASLRASVTLLTGQLDREVDRRRIAEQVAEVLRKGVRGCRFLGVKCLEATVTYDATDGGLQAGVLYPIAKQVNAGVVWRVVR